MFKTMKIVFAILLFHCPYSMAQEKNIENEILNNTYTDLEIVSKSRNFIYINLAKNDIEKVEEIIGYLSEKFDQTSVVTLWDIEKYLISYWTSNYDFILTEITSYQDKTITDYSDMLVPPKDLLYKKIRELSIPNYDHLISSIESSNLSTQQKEFLVLFFDFLVFDPNDPSFISQNDLNNSATEFIEKHKQSEFDFIIRHHIRRIYEPSNWGFGIDLFSGWGKFTDGLETYFEPNIPIGVAVNVYYKGWMVYIRDYIGVESSAKRAFTYNGDWKKDLELEVFLLELSIGYNIHDGQFLRLAPFLGISSMDISPPEQIKYQPGNDVGLDFATTYTAGINIDLKISKGLSFPLVDLNEQSFWYLQIRLGYNKPTYYKRDSRFRGELLYFNIGIGGFGRANKRVI